MSTTPAGATPAAAAGARTDILERDPASGSLHEYLAHRCAAIGGDVICTHLEEKSGLLTGR